MKNVLTLIGIGFGIWIALQSLDEGTKVTAGAGSPHGSPSGFLSNYETALARGRETGKPVVLVFSASWCPPCQQMKKEVYPSADVLALKNDFVWAYLDVDQPSTHPAAANYGVRGIPHIQFVSSTGRDLGNVVGGRSSSHFASELREVLKKAS